MSSDDYEISAAYEWLRMRVEGLVQSSDGHARDVDWLGTDRVLGAARTDDGSVELFIGGPALPVSDAAVRRSAHHATWVSSGAAEFEATRITLPAAPHFDRVAAFICAELFESRVLDDARSAFVATEPVIALAFRRAKEGDPFLLGLAGELLFLRALLRAAPAPDKADILHSWKGADRSTRDFQIGAVGVEVKATTSDVSEHYIHGVAQTQPGISVDGAPETALYLLSVGIEWLDDDVTHGESVEDLIGSIVAELQPSGLQDDFFRLIATYGDGSARVRGATSIVRGRRFHVVFERLYDMCDARIKLPSAADLEPFEHLVSDSLNFRVWLPEKVNGDFNPVVTFPEAARTVLDRA